MQPDQWEILVLKPTPAFLNYLQTQFPQAILPEFRLLQTDNTGYLFRRHGSDEELLDEIESKYVKMFKHEIKRWLGENQISQDVQASFLDFLCCFKFEMHSHILLMEDSFLDGQQMLCIKPRSVMTKWIRSQFINEDSDGEVMTHLDVEQWAENGTVVIKNLASVYDLKPFLRLHYYPLYEAEMIRMCEGFTEWPEVDSYQMFCRYFVVEYHTQLIHLS